MEQATQKGPEVNASTIRFRIPDPERDLRAVRLHQEVKRPRNGPELKYDAEQGAWVGELDRPRADRVEYLVELVHSDGATELICDPMNEERAPGAFGEKSVAVMPGYGPPSWLDAEEAPPGTRRELSLTCRAVKGHIPVSLWSPPDTSPAEPLPILVANDGPEYDSYSGLTRFFEAGIAAGTLPKFRAALLAPVDRNEIYSASAAYARSFAHVMLPELLESAPTPSGREARIAMGASLGGLSMLHIHRRTPATFGALFLQSGSFFRIRYDKHESGFPRFRRISRFVGEVLGAETWSFPIPITMTCGLIEENLANNRAVHDALAAQGYETSFVANRDGHNWTGWRDTFEPHLTGLIQRMWG